MQIVTEKKCPPCNKLKNMLNKLNVSYNECTVEDVPESIKQTITGVPAVFMGTNLLFSGAPGNIESLKSLLSKAGVI